MLKDPKAHALVEEFGGQWLQTRALESVKPDRDRYPDFEDYLRMSMRRETEMFFESIVREDRSILDFIDGKYTFLNERLAQLYGIPGVTGPEFRRVDLTGTQRGGVLTQGSVLTVSSYATRTSPVLRGKWILENLLNAPPPAPPPNVPRLNEEAGSEHPRRCGSRWKSIAPTRSALPVTPAWIRSASVLKISTASAHGGRRTESFRSTLPARFRTGNRSGSPMSWRPS